MSLPSFLGMILTPVAGELRLRPYFHFPRRWKPRWWSWSFFGLAEKVCWVEDNCFPLDISAEAESLDLFFPKFLSSFLRACSPGDTFSLCCGCWKMNRALSLPLHWQLSPWPLPKSPSPGLRHLSRLGRNVSRLPGSIKSWTPCSELQRDETLGELLVSTPSVLSSQEYLLVGAGSPSWAFYIGCPQRFVSHPGFIGETPWARLTWLGQGCLHYKSANTTASGSWSGPGRKTW